MDWSDDIAYSVHDLEDGIVTGYLQPATWGTDTFLHALHRSVTSAPVKWANGPPSEEEIADRVRPLYDRLAPRAPDVPMDVIRETTREYIDKFVCAANVIAEGEVASSFDFRLDVPEEIRVENQVPKSITFEFILRDPRTVQIFHKGEKIIRLLFRGALREREDQGPQGPIHAVPAMASGTSRGRP